MGRTRRIRFRDPNYIEIVRNVRGVVEEGLSKEQKEDEYKCYLAEFEHSGNFPSRLTGKGFDDVKMLDTNHTL